jgi:hypothetical protein
MLEESLAQLVYLNTDYNRNSAITAKRLATRHFNTRIIRNVGDALRKATTITTIVK